jgi:hypothetical protein
MGNGTTTLMVALTGRGSPNLTPEAPMFQAVRMLLDKGANVNATGTNGSTFLHQTVNRGPAFVRMLVEHGAKLDVKDGSGRTPLDIALGVAAPAAAGGRGRGGPWRARGSLRVPVVLRPQPIPPSSRCFANWEHLPVRLAETTELHAVVAPAPDSAKTKFLHAVWSLPVHEAIPTVNNTEIFEKSG